MLITVTTGIGDGPTPLAAFDAALLDAGVANYNLICLSSIIPSGGVIERAKHVTPPDEYGHRLYVVMARHDEQCAGKAAWAGLGWCQDHDTGCGLFVELHGSNRTDVESSIASTLGAMRSRRRMEFGPICQVLSGIECHGTPVCSLVIAVYRSENWE